MNRKFALIFLLAIGFSALLAGYRIPSVHAIIWVEGHITSDTTWSPVDTYRVIDNTYVDPGVTLTILPGVHVQVADGFSLVVDGNLNATGTSLNPIVFTSSRVAQNPPNPYPGAWNTIRFQGNSSCEFKLENAKIEYAIHGVTVNSLGATMIEKSEILDCSENGVFLVSESNVVVRENTLQHNKNGIGTYLFSEITSGVAIVNNQVQSNLENGIYIYSYNGIISNITISSNTVSYNGEHGVYLYSKAGTGDDAYISNVTISLNAISFNGKNGIYLNAASEAGWYWYTYVSNSIISSNAVSYNGENGISVNSQSGWRDNSYIVNATFSSNKVFSNDKNGIYIGAGGTKSSYDCLVWNNTVSANLDKGMLIQGRPKVNITGNSFSYNSYGIVCSESQNSLASHNDIYDNTYGMNVASGATVNAEYNYWGDSTGPYHPSLNPEGKGNPVNGNGVDLDFIPFLTSPQGQINQRPVAALSVDKHTININETVIFDATNSTDDGRIDYYFFDFGDGTNSSWTSLPVVTHKYALNGTYYATVTVMDDYGVTSTNAELIKVQIIVVPEFPSPLILLIFMIITLLAVVIYRKKTVNMHLGSY